ncbi:MAG: SDR family NAD(P)-dependent oxidoreductase [Devosia sp.]
MKKQFKQQYGNWALVTGATSGIGAELADQVAARGLNVVLVARKQADLDRHAGLLGKKHGVETRTISADLTTREGVDAVLQTQTEIGLLVLAAGLEVNGAFEKTPVEQEERTLQINVISTFRLCHYFSKDMVARGRGGILLVSSLSGHMANPYFANYAGSKAYVLNLGASLYGEFKPKGVDVSVLSPGLTNTPMVADNGVNWSKTPMKPMQPAAVAAAGLDGLGQRFLTIPGARNRLMAAAMKFSPIAMVARMNEKMLKGAFDPAKL